MSARRKTSRIVLIAGALLLLAVGGGLLLRWVGKIFFDGLWGSCPPDVALVNSTCASLENEEDLRLKCSSPTGTREWAACERRDHFFLSWDPEVDSGWQGSPGASGWVSEGVGIADSGPWHCSNGALSLSLYPSSIPSGEEGRATIAFAKVCARFVNAPRAK